MAADYLAPCGSTAFCIFIGSCAKCRPGTWREVLPAHARHDHPGSLGGASYEFARKSVQQLAAGLREVAAELDAAYGDGFRLYEIDNDGTIRLVKGRSPR